MHLFVFIEKNSDISSTHISRNPLDVFSILSCEGKHNVIGRQQLGKHSLWQASVFYRPMMSVELETINNSESSGKFLDNCSLKFPLFFKPEDQFLSRYLNV